MEDSPVAESPLRSGWWVLAIAVLASQFALGGLAGVLAYTEAYTALALITTVHASARMWLPLLLLVALLALVDRVRGAGPLSWGGAILAVVPLLALSALSQKLWWLDIGLLTVLSLAGATVLGGLGLVVLAVLDRSPAIGLHALWVGTTGGLGMLAILWPRMMAVDIHLHDTLFLTGTTHLAALVLPALLCGAAAVRWRPWSTLLPSAVLGFGFAMLVVPQLQAGLRGMPTRYPAMEMGPGVLPLVGGGLAFAGLLLLVGLAAWRPSRTS